MKMRKTLFLSIPIALFLLTVFLGYKIWNASQAKDKIKATTQYLPSIQLRKNDGSILYTDSLKYKELLVLNYFNPECEHCISMVQEMFNEQTKIKNVTWLMITTNTREKTKRFSDSLNLTKLPNVTVLNDTAYQFAKVFGTITVPSFYVYKNGRLLRTQSGECSINYLIHQ
jgi:peroxiredoxin